MTKEELELALRREKALGVKLQRMVRDLIRKFKKQQVQTHREIFEVTDKKLTLEKALADAEKKFSDLTTLVADNLDCFDRLALLENYLTICRPSFIYRIVRFSKYDRWRIDPYIHMEETNWHQQTQS